MTSIVDKYYGRIIQNIDNVRMKSDISTLFVKSKEHESKINNIENDISDNLELIKDNIDDINDNETNISSNLAKIGDNETNISSNLTKIGDNETNIPSNLTKIGVNETNISSNLTKIGDNETNISPNLTKIGVNETNISSNLTKINSIEENNSKISNNVFNDKYDIEKQPFNFNKNSHSYILFQKILEYDFNTDGELIINIIINYKYDNLKMILID